MSMEIILQQEHEENYKERIKKIMNDKEAIIGNLTTILMFVFSTIGGGAIIESLGGTSQTAILIGAILGLAYSIINAYFPNKFAWLKNNTNEIQTIADAIPKECNCDIEESEC